MDNNGQVCNKGPNCTIHTGYGEHNGPLVRCPQCHGTVCNLGSANMCYSRESLNKQDPKDKHTKSKEQSIYSKCGVL